ncbi:sulfatase [Parapedobacter tibetensis]|uniref:sulfatase n=1 Tax=Parapedobacter tibetensis TaxID=2972951 RepID=UPI00214DCF95|nr:sulfatase [Parapedobacter tibetensis]
MVWINVKYSLLCCALVWLTGRASAAGDGHNERPGKPNVLFIAVDDLRPQLGCYGDAVAITPNIDRLANRGVVFNHAYCQQAVCAPSRASVLTGRRPDATKVWDLQTHFRQALPDVVTLPQHFKQHGYDVRGVGKIYHDPKSAQDPVSWSTPPVLAVTDDAGGKYVLSENLVSKTSWKAAATESADVPDSAYVDGRVCNAAIAAIRELKDTSFFLAVGFRRPHLPFSAPKKYWDLYDDSQIPKPSRTDPPGHAPEIALHDGVELRGYTDIPDMGPLSDEQIHQLRHGYYASISFIDAQIGNLLDELARQGLLDNTIIVLWSDHGFHLGELGLWCKTTNFELDTRVPLIISAPDHSGNGMHTDAVVELVDLYPTLSELADLPVSGDLGGASLAPLLADPDRRWKSVAFSQFPRPWMYKDTPDVMGYSVRSPDFRYTEWRNMNDASVMATELYSYDGEGIETENLAGRTEYKKALRKMRTMLRKGQKGTILRDR